MQLFYSKKPIWQVFSLMCAFNQRGLQTTYNWNHLAECFVCTVKCAHTVKRRVHLERLQMDPYGSLMSPYGVHMAGAAFYGPLWGPFVSIIGVFRVKLTGIPGGGFWAFAESS